MEKDVDTELIIENLKLKRKLKETRTHIRQMRRTVTTIGQMSKDRYIHRAMWDLNQELRDIADGIEIKGN